MTTFGLKMSGLILMVLDHIGLYFAGAPVWLRWPGRGSYPLFLFCMTQGLRHTRDRKKYLLRLYLMSLLMTLFGCGVDLLLPTEGGYGNHNIFLPMFLVGVLVTIIEVYQEDRRRGMILLAGLWAVQMLYGLLPGLLPFTRALSGDVLTGVVPNLAIHEYGPAFLALGVGMYFLWDRRELFCVGYLLFCIFQFSAEMLESGGASQWMMVLALPLLLHYNGERGPGVKAFFYLFYPLHTVLLFIWQIL